MWRVALGIGVGFILWWLIGTAGFLLLRALWHDYAIAEPGRAFTLGMQLFRLLIGVLCSVGAGWTAARVVGRRSAAPWILGWLLVALFVPMHYIARHDFPLWYHLLFLFTLAPIVGYSGTFAWRTAAARANTHIQNA